MKNEFGNPVSAYPFVAGQTLPFKQRQRFTGKKLQPAVNHNQTVSLAGHNVSQFFFRFNKSNDGFLC